MISYELLGRLLQKAKESERLRLNFDLGMTPNDISQWMLNVLEHGTKVPIYRHLKTSENVVCLEGCLDWVCFEELPKIDYGGPVHDSETAADETSFEEIARFRVCPRETMYGVQMLNHSS